MSTFLVSTGVIGFLFFYTTQKSFLNNFVRKLPLHALGVSDLVDIRYKNFYFAGASDSRIFLGNSSAPLYVFQHRSFAKRHRVTEAETGRQGLHLHSCRTARALIKIVFIFSMEYRRLFIRAIPEQGAILRQTSGRDKIYFTDAVAYGPSSFAMRIFDGISRENVLVRKTITDTLHLEPAPGILQKQVDGIFCTDGSLLYDPTLGTANLCLSLPERIYLHGYCYENSVSRAHDRHHYTCTYKG